MVPGLHIRNKNSEIFQTIGNYQDLPPGLVSASSLEDQGFENKKYSVLSKKIKKIDSKL